jgi:hypothetical protein
MFEVNLWFSCLVGSEFHGVNWTSVMTEVNFQLSFCLIWSELLGVIFNFPRDWSELLSFFLVWSEFLKTMRTSILYGMNFWNFGSELPIILSCSKSTSKNKENFRCVQSELFKILKWTSKIFYHVRIFCQVSIFFELPIFLNWTFENKLIMFEVNFSKFLKWTSNTLQNIAILQQVWSELPIF